MKVILDRGVVIAGRTYPHDTDVDPAKLVEPLKADASDEDKANHADQTNKAKAEYDKAVKDGFIVNPPKAKSEPAEQPVAKEGKGE